MVVVSSKESVHLFGLACVVYRGGHSDTRPSDINLF